MSKVLPGTIKRFLLLALVTALLVCRGPLPSTATSTMPALGSLSAQTIAAQADQYLSNLATEAGFSGSVLMARHGEILLSSGYGEADRERHILNTAQTRFRLSSLTKQFTAMAILILQERGALNVQDRICMHLADCPARWQAITIHQLLTHTAGIPDFNRLPDFWATIGLPSSPAETIARFQDQPLEFLPGEKFRYSNSGYILLGAIIEQASGSTYETFLQDSIFAPLQMADSGYDHNAGDLAVGYRDRSTQADFIDMSIPFAAGGVYSTVADLYRWDRALYTEQLISQALLDQMFTPFVPILDGGGFGPGYGWFIGKEGDRPMASHAGAINGFSSMITRYPQDHTFITVLSNREDTNLAEIQMQLTNILFKFDSSM
ncbi:MAG: penicillin-binding protein [Shackletoniella antarctica]|uniref:Penicillin-binding protein n=1 Tax=Shackletoniella antarctica TaxID=268115 RepID=A0A2W4WA20_9CYAN|nr:MAG: penicillin-binding protein [Shackletoniella antarctica]